MASDIPPDLVQRHFTRSPNSPSLVFSRHLRESVVFARHDVLTDPPFSRTDLVVCRNFLIYLEHEAQDRCLSLFHYALRSGGLLFLGNAEGALGKGAVVYFTTERPTQQEKNRTLLIIDDSEDDIDMTSHVLSRLGWPIRTESASSGEETSARLEDDRELPDVVLQDLKMRGLDGIEVLRHLRARARWSAIPVLILTHSGLESDLAAAREAGAAGVIHKTVSIAQFKSEMREALEPWLGPTH